MTGVIDIEGRPLDDFIARVTVLHSIRSHLKELTDLRATTLVGDKIVSDFLLFAHSRAATGTALPVDQTTWLVNRWAAALESSSELISQDDRFPQFTADLVARVLDSLRGWQRDDDDAVGRLFEEVRRLTHDLYGDRRILDSALEIGHLGAHPGSRNQFPDPYSLTAGTTRSAEAATVRVWFHLKGFGPETYAALLRVLVHECVAHVSSSNLGHGGPATPTSDVSNSSTFAEGLMDHAAEYFTERWTMKIDPDLAVAARHHGREVARVLPYRDLAGRARLIGFEAGEQIVRFFVQIGIDEGQARQRAAQLAVELNRSGRPLTEKDHLISKLTPPLPMEIQQALMTWEGGHLDADSVLDAALERTLLNE